jgi:hypothetical protein
LNVRIIKVVQRSGYKTLLLKRNKTGFDLI